MSYIRNNIVVCDGGDTDCDGIKKSFADNNIYYLRIRDSDLWVADTVNPSISLHYVGLDKSSVFIRLCEIIGDFVYYLVPHGILIQVSSYRTFVLTYILAIGF